MTRPIRRCRRNKKNSCLLKRVEDPLKEAKENLENLDLKTQPEVAESRLAIIGQIDAALWLLESSMWMDDADRETKSDV